MAGGALRQVCAGRVSEETLVEAIDQHCKGKYPREFGHKFRRGFLRNQRCDSARDVYEKARFFDFVDCYCSVYSYSEWYSAAEDRRKFVRIDTVLFDIDIEGNLAAALAQAKKLVKYLLNKDITPRVYFSGAKGFHIYVDFPEVTLYDFRSVKDVASYFVSKLRLCLDMNVYEPNRVARLPYTVNSKTGYFCVPIPVEKLLSLHMFDVLHMAKEPRVYDIEIVENDSFLRYIRYFDTKRVLEDMPPIEVPIARKRKKLRPRLEVENFEENWRQRRIRYYAEVLKKHGYLSADPYIVSIHSGGKNVDPKNPGSVEHIARVHLVLLMIEEGYSDEEIHAVFRHAKDYDPQKTQYFIDYNRKWLKQKK